MKRFLILMMFVYSCIIINAQVPQGFNYQAIARGSDGKEITNTKLEVEISILSDTNGFYSSGKGNYLWEELQTVRTNSLGLFTLTLGNPLAIKIQGSAASFSVIDWKQEPLYIGTKINYTGWKNMGTSRLWSVPYAMVSGDLAGPVQKLSVTGNTTLMDEALFEVKNKAGQIVFAVYSEGVRIYVEDGIAKGKGKGGFAIGSFGTAKAASQPYFVVDPDSIRAYIDNNPVKALKGGFAIGGFDKAKAANQQFLTVSDDSIRFYINDSPGKATKGGFAIGGFDKAKGGNTSFLNVETDLNGTINPSQNRILWYPLKNAFLTGKVMIEKPDSVGINSFASGFESKAKGGWSQALGFQSVARGNYSTAIGKYAVANSPSSFAFGNSAQAMNESSFAFGTGAKALGINSYALGSIGIDTLGNPTGKNTISSGNNSVAIGMGSQSTNLGAFSFGIGNIASGEFSLAMGFESKSPAHYGIAIGRWATAYEAFSIAIGDSAYVPNNTSIAIGKKVKALGTGCLTLGSYSESWGYSSIAIGSYVKSKAWAISIGGFTNASGFYSTAIGYKTSATGVYSNAFGRESVASGDNSFAFGHLTKASGNYSYSFGFGSESKNLYAIAMGSFATSSGNASFSAGTYTLAGGNYSVAMGRYTTASGSASMATGNNSSATGDYSLAVGNSAIASGSSSVSLGQNTIASGNSSTALGYNNTATGNISTSLGRGTVAQSFCSLVLGQYNTTSGTTYDWIATDPVLVVGNGVYGAPSDAFTVFKNGNTYVQGNVGIGTTSPVTKLDLSGGNNWDLVNGEGDFRIGNSSYRLKVGVALGGGGAGAVGIMQYGVTGGYNVLSLGAQGSYQLFINGSTQRVGIGTDAPGYKLTVNGTAWCSSGIWAGSDIRWKKNIKVLDNTLQGILSLQGVNYDLRTDEFPEMGFESGRQVGLIAQDVEEVFPQLVNTDNNGYKAVAYDKLSVLLVEGMKEQQRQIETYKAENENLKSKLETLQEKVDQIEAMIAKGGLK
jgi:hypothetical protein